MRGDRGKRRACTRILSIIIIFFSFFLLLFRGMPWCRLRLLPRPRQSEETTGSISRTTTEEEEVRRREGEQANRGERDVRRRRRRRYVCITPTSKGAIPGRLLYDGPGRGSFLSSVGHAMPCHAMPCHPWISGACRQGEGRGKRPGLVPLSPPLPALRLPQPMTAARRSNRGGCRADGWVAQPTPQMRRRCQVRPCRPGGKPIGCPAPGRRPQAQAARTRWSPARP